MYNIILIAYNVMYCTVLYIFHNYDITEQIRS